MEKRPDPEPVPDPRQPGMAPVSAISRDEQTQQLSPAWQEVECRRIGKTPPAIVVAEEIPIGLLYDGVPYAVMMATPQDLDDFSFGFSRTEGIIQAASDIRSLAVRSSPDGIELDIRLAPERLHAFLARHRVRSLRGHTSCGLCGVEDVADARIETPRASPGSPFTSSAMRRALAGLFEKQPLNRLTHATHAAAWASPEGELLLLREDVGRHNALDKLIGAALRRGIDVSQGFCVITSRCSYEMVQKALMAQMPAIVAISGPTALAIRTARAAGLTLVAVARDDGQVVYVDTGRVRPE